MLESEHRKLVIKEEAGKHLQRAQDGVKELRKAKRAGAQSKGVQGSKMRLGELLM